jgi:hypothetical protein
LLYTTQRHLSLCRDGPVHGYIDLTKIYNNNIAAGIAMLIIITHCYILHSGTRRYVEMAQFMDTSI